MKVSRSGDLHLITDGEKGRLLNAETGWIGRVAPAESIGRMTTVHEPWSDLAEPDWPEPVRRAAESLRAAPSPSEATP